MKVFYNSKLAKVLTFMEGFSTMMFFGIVLTERSKLSKKTLKHEETHVHQYQDCVGLGLAIAIASIFILFAFEVESWWMLLLILIPLLIYYVIYGIEYVYWCLRGFRKDDAYKRIGFERQAYGIAETWDLPCEKQRLYGSFGWWRKLK